MKTDQIQPLNYCAHAIEDLTATAELLAVAAPQSARVLGQLIGMLKSSVKFILPNCCNLVDPADIRQAHIDLIHLPYPCVAFEVPWNQEDSGPDRVGDFAISSATKRIALCWEARPEFELLPGLNSVLTKYPDGGAFVVPIYWGPDFKSWTVAMGGTFLPYNNELMLRAPDEECPASIIAHTAKEQAGQLKVNSRRIWSEPFFLLPEIFDHALSQHGDLDKAYAQIILDSHDEAMILMQACSVINCANVLTEDIQASAALNKKRQENGKHPFFSYKILQLSDQQSSTTKRAAGVSHASPRMHLRRGHLRRLDSKVIWVRPAMIAAGSNAGVVVKDYSVSAKA